MRLPEAIGKGAQRVGIGFGDDARQDGHLADGDRRQRLEGRAGGLLGAGGGLFEQAFLFAQQGLDAFRDAFGRASQRGGGLLEAFQTMAHALQRARPVTASMRRMPAATLPSLVIRNIPITPVSGTCVPPHSS